MLSYHHDPELKIEDLKMIMLRGIGFLFHY